jgi:colanic acid biosynthesis glycosyl transferase WcaI
MKPAPRRPHEIEPLLPFAMEPFPVTTRVRLDRFDPSQGLHRGRPKWVEALWYLVKCLFFLSPLPWPSGFKATLLRGFGARIGRGVVIKPRVNIHLPWKLEVGDHAWIGEEACILNLEPVTLGSHCCISQRVFLCTGNHDFRRPEFPYRNRPIVVEDGVWIGACCFVAPGTRVGTDSVVQAHSTVSGTLEGNFIYRGHPLVAVSPRWTSPEPGSEPSPSAEPARAQPARPRVKTRILIHGLNYSPELTGVGNYTGPMAAWLAARPDVEVKVITAHPYYPEWKISDTFLRHHPGSFLGYRRHEEQGVDVIRCPLYVPPRPGCATRILHLASFALTSLPAFLALGRWRPDLVLLVEPTLATHPAGLLYAAGVGAKTWLHVQDCEVDAMLGLGLAGRSPLARVLLAWDSWLKRRFDRVSTISGSMANHLRTKGVTRHRLRLLPNWVDLREFHPGPADPDLRASWGVAPDATLFLYSGNMGEKQGLEAILEVASRLRDDARCQFLFVGGGAIRQRLLAAAEEAGILRTDPTDVRPGRNVLFLPLLPREQLADALRTADVHLVPQKRGAADLVLPSKLGPILAVGGRAIVTAEPQTELGRLEAANPGVYLRIAPEDAEALHAAVVSLTEARLEGPCSAAAAYAALHLDQRRILETFLREARDLVQPAPGKRSLLPSLEPAPASEGPEGVTAAPHPNQRTLPS